VLCCAMLCLIQPTGLPSDSYTCFMVIHGVSHAYQSAAYHPFLGDVVSGHGSIDIQPVLSCISYDIAIVWGRHNLILVTCF
jgi:hypothetical protein